METYGDFIESFRESVAESVEAGAKFFRTEVGQVLKVQDITRGRQPTPTLEEAAKFVTNEIRNFDAVTDQNHGEVLTGKTLEAIQEGHRSLGLTPPKR